jgi:hypothetical protein
MWIVPSEFSKALEGLAGLAGGSGSGAGDGSGNGVPSWLAATSTGGGSGAGSSGEPIPTEGWFDSNLPPAAEQPEASSIRASDDDPDSRAAHEGIAEPLHMTRSLDAGAPPTVPSLPEIPPLPTPGLAGGPDDLGADDNASQR